MADIPPVSDYSHWNEEAESMWYAENRYDMMYPPEPDNDPYEEFYEEFYDDDDDDDST